MFNAGKQSHYANRKGQIVLYDMIFAVAVFLLVFGTFYVYYSHNFETFNSEIKMREMQALAEMSFDTLLNSKGIPDNWTGTDVNVIGIVSLPKIINSQKLAKLQSMDYLAAKQKLLFGKYDFFLEFKNPQQTITVGLQPTDTNYLRAVLNSIVLKDGVNTNVEFTIYE